MWSSPAPMVELLDLQDRSLEKGGEGPFSGTFDVGAILPRSVSSRVVGEANQQ